MPYAFTPEDYSKFQEDVLKANGDQAVLTTVLADFQTTFMDSKAVVESTRAENDRLDAENKRLKDANMNLFLRIGEQIKPQAQEPPVPEPDDEPKYKDVGSYMAAFFESKKK